eukprot:56794-Eustigmatos_ZCMA.PRE.1
MLPPCRWDHLEASGVDIVLCTSLRSPPNSVPVTIVPGKRTLMPYRRLGSSCYQPGWHQCVIQPVSRRLQRAFELVNYCRPHTHYQGLHEHWGL